MADPNTFIKLHRSLLDHWLWEEKPFSKGQAWVDLLLIANYADEKKPVGDHTVVYKRGTVPRSIASLALRWGWNRKTVSKFLQLLESEKMVSTKRTTYGTTITIEKYSVFQNVGSTIRTSKGQPSGQPWDSDGTQYKNIKEIKKIKETGEGASPPNSEISSPSLDDVRAFCQEIGTSVSPEKFFYRMESLGWCNGGKKIKDWRAAVREWDATEYKDKKQPTVSAGETDSFGRPIKPRWER